MSTSTCNICSTQYNSVHTYLYVSWIWKPCLFEYILMISLFFDKKVWKIIMHRNLKIVLSFSFIHHIPNKEKNWIVRKIMYKYLITILYALWTWYTISLFAFCLKSPEYHVNQNELLFTCRFDIFLEWIVPRSWFQTIGIFTSRVFIRRCWNTFIYKIYIYIALKTTDKKMSCTLNSYQNTYTFKNGYADCFGKNLWDLLWESKINANAYTYAQERIKHYFCLWVKECG